MNLLKLVSRNCQIIFPKGYADLQSHYISTPKSVISIHEVESDLFYCVCFFFYPKLSDVYKSNKTG